MKSKKRKPGLKNPPGHVPHVIDWDKARRTIREFARGHRDALIKMSRGGCEGVDDGYRD